MAYEVFQAITINSNTGISTPVTVYPAVASPGTPAMMCVNTLHPVYITREQAMEFFGLVIPLIY